MTKPPPPARSRAERLIFFLAALALSAVIAACSIYANLSSLVSDPADYRFFPPFEQNVNANEIELLLRETVIRPECL